MTFFHLSSLLKMLLSILFYITGNDVDALGDFHPVMSDHLGAEKTMRLPVSANAERRCPGIIDFMIPYLKVNGQGVKSSLPGLALANPGPLR